VVRSGLIDDQGMKPSIQFRSDMTAANRGSLEVKSSAGNAGNTWAVSTFQLRNPQGQKAWTLGSPVLLGADGKPVKVRSVWMEKPQLGPGEEGLLMVETLVPPWDAGGAFRLELPDRESTRRLSVRVARE
jgi:hypothetical protein